MKVNFAVSGAGSMARERALTRVRQAIAKREAELVTMPARKPSTNETGPVRAPSSQGGK